MIWVWSLKKKSWRFFYYRSSLALSKFPHCKDTIPKIETNIPRKGIAWPQSQFSHPCVCDRLIYFHDRSAYSAAGKYVTDPGYI